MAIIYFLFLGIILQWIIATDCFCRCVLPYIAVYWQTFITSVLTHWGLVTPYGNRELGQQWLRWWLVAWRHQAITSTNVDLSSVRSCGFHVRAISQEMTQSSITKTCLKITCLKFHSNYPGANELNALGIQYSLGNQYGIRWKCQLCSSTLPKLGLECYFWLKFWLKCCFLYWISKSGTLPGVKIV